MWEQIRTTFLESFGRMGRTIAQLLPGVVVMLVLLVLTALVALAASALVRRLFTRLDVDRHLREWGMAAPPREGRLGPTRLVARWVAWTVVALGFILGLSVLESSATSALAGTLLAYVPHALVGLVILAAGVAGSRALERSVLIGAVNMGIHSARLLGLGARWLVLVLASAMALEQLGIGGGVLTAAFAILFGGIVLSLSIAVGLGAREVVARSLERHFKDQPEDKDSPSGDTMHHL
jgi:hypothetical protein